MSTKLSNSIKSLLEKDDFNLEHESKMVQARFLSTFLNIIEDKKLTQLDLEKMTGLKQPFLSGLFNQRRKLNMEHIALFQNALKIKLQPPEYLNSQEHNEKFYLEEDYKPIDTYFPDSFSLKKERIISWARVDNYNKNIEKQAYSLIENESLENHFYEKNMEYNTVDENY